MMVVVMILQRVFCAYAVGTLKDLHARVGVKQLHLVNVALVPKTRVHVCIHAQLRMHLQTLSYTLT